MSNGSKLGGNGISIAKKDVSPRFVSLGDFSAIIDLGTNGENKVRGEVQ